jgi:hypothetical protein
LDDKKKPGKHMKIVVTESDSDDEMSVQVISAPKKKSQMKTVNSSDVINKKREYQKKLKSFKEHWDLTGEEGENPEEESCCWHDTKQPMI